VAFGVADETPIATTACAPSPRCRSWATRRPRRPSVVP